MSFLSLGESDTVADVPDEDELNACDICFEEPKTMVFIQCRHACICYRCRNNMGAYAQGHTRVRKGREADKASNRGRLCETHTSIWKSLVVCDRVACWL